MKHRDRLFGSAPEDSNPIGQPEPVDYLVEEDRTAEEWFEKRHSEIRPRQRQRDARKAGSRANIDYIGVERDQLLDHRAVENVAIPDPVHLARADQASNHTVGGEEFRVGLGAIQVGAEDLVGRWKECVWEIARGETGRGRRVRVVTGTGAG